MLKFYRTNLLEKLEEALRAVIPIILIVLFLCFTIAPISPGLLMVFLIGAVLLVVGMMFFTLGADLAMTPIGERVGTAMTQSRKLAVIIPLAFLLGVIITVSEPDLQVLAQQVPSVPNLTLIVTVACGVGVFLVIAVLRMLFGIALPWLLVFFYLIVFALAYFVPESFLAVAFDAGGVTTGPMTVPFIMALGVGVASIRSDENAKADSFGLVALCSIGPVLAVMLLGAIYPTDTQADVSMIIGGFKTSVDLGFAYLHSLPDYLLEVAMALLPIFVFFLLFQVFSLHLRRLPLTRIVMGVGYTFLGLVLFLTGVNVGFSPLGYVLGSELVSSGLSVLLIPLAMLMGWFIIDAEPAVHILNKQVEELTSGAISAKAMGLSLSVAVALANGLAMVRVLTGLPILYFLVPGYAVALGLSFFVPRTFTAIAFDSGGVASGPLTATFMLPLAMGACTALGGNVMTDAFGLVALVAMMPLITVQVMGGIYVLKSKQKTQAPAMPSFGENEIIELWEAV